MKRVKRSKYLHNRLKIYSSYAEKQIREAFSRYHDWGVFENKITTAVMTCSKLIGANVLLKAFAKLRHLNSIAKLLTKELVSVV